MALFVTWRNLWFCKLCLDLNVLSQRLQGMTIPSRWFASMWSFMFGAWPSFPQTLHRSANLTPLAILFWLFSIIDFTLSSSSSKSPEKLLGIATVVFSSGLWISLMGACLLKEGFGIFACALKADKGFSSSSKFLDLSFDLRVCIWAIILEVVHHWRHVLLCWHKTKRAIIPNILYILRVCLCNVMAIIYAKLLS